MHDPSTGAATPAPTEPPVPGDAGTALHAAASGVGDLLRLMNLDLHRYVQLVARQVGVATTDVHAIGVLQAADGPVSATVLAHELGLTPSATSSLVDRLQHDGHAVRRVSRDDARRAAIEATDVALGHSSQEFSPLNAGIRAALAACDPDDVAAFHRVLALVQEQVHAATEAYSRH